MRNLISSLILAVVFTGCIEPPRQVEEMPFVTRDRDEQSRMLALIDRADIPSSHLTHPVDRYPSLLSNKNNDVAKFAELYLEAKAGRPRSMGSVGYYYYKGMSPIEKNYAEAVRWFTLGAEADDADSQVYLAECLYFELGTTKDVNRARKLLDRAKQQGRKSYRITFDDSSYYVLGEGVKPAAEVYKAPPQEKTFYAFTIKPVAFSKPQTRFFLEEYAGSYYFGSLSERETAASAFDHLYRLLKELDLEALNEEGTLSDQRNRFVQKLEECKAAHAVFDATLISAKKR